MASTTIDAHLWGDGRAYRSAGVSWADVEGGTGTGSSTSIRTRAYHDGASWWSCERAFVGFDLTGLPAGWVATDVELYMKVESRSSTDDKVIVVKWTETGEPSVNASDYVLHSTVFSTSTTTPAANNWQTMGLFGSTVATYLNNQTEDYGYFCIMDYYYDYFTNTPSGALDKYSEYYNSGDSGNEPYLSVDYDVINDGDSQHYSEINLIEESTHYSEVDLWTESTHYSEIDLTEESAHFSNIIMFGVDDSIHYSEIYMGTQSIHYSYIDMIEESTHHSYIDLIVESTHYSQIVMYGIGDSQHDSYIDMFEESTHYSYIDMIAESVHHSEILMLGIDDSQHESKIDLIIDDAHYSQINMLLIDPAEWAPNAGTGDGMVEKVHADWSTAWNASTGDSADSLSTTHMVGGIYTGGNYYIRRYMAYFNTAPIPDDAIITHVELDIYVHSKAGDGVTWYCIAWTDGFPVTIDDYDGFGSTLFGSVAATSIGWKTMVFNKDGENHINLTADTEIYIRGEHDYNNDTPIDATSSYLRTGRYTDYQPILTVNYYLEDENSGTHYSQIDMVAESTHHSYIDLIIDNIHYSHIDLYTESPPHFTQIIMTSIGDSQHYSEIFMNVESTHYSQVYVDNWDSVHYSEIDIIPFGSTTQITNKNYLFDELVTVLPRWLQPEDGMNDQIIIQTLSEEMFLLIEFAEYIRDLSDIDSMRMYSGSGELTRNEALDDWSTLLNRERAPWETDEELRTRMNDYAETFHEAGTLYRYRDAIDDFFTIVGDKTNIKMWEPMNTNAIASQSLFVNNHNYISYFDTHPEHFVYCPNGDENQRVKYFWVDESASGEGQWHPFIIPDARNFATVALTIPTTESSSLSGASGTTEGIEYDKSNTPFIRVIDTASGDLADGVYYNTAGDQYYVWDVLGMEDNFAFRLTDRRDVITYDVDTFIFFTDTDESSHYSEIEMTT